MQGGTRYSVSGGFEHNPSGEGVQAQMEMCKTLGFTMLNLNTHQGQGRQCTSRSWRSTPCHHSVEAPTVMAFSAEAGEQEQTSLLFLQAATVKCALHQTQRPC